MHGLLKAPPKPCTRLTVLSLALFTFPYLSIPKQFEQLMHSDVAASEALLFYVCYYCCTLFTATRHTSQEQQQQQQCDQVLEADPQSSNSFRLFTINFTVNFTVRFTVRSRA